MKHSNAQLLELVSAAETAYRRARIEVYDGLTPGTKVDLEALTSSQRGALDDLTVAEAELANCRFQRYSLGMAQTRGAKATTARAQHLLTAGHK